VVDIYELAGGLFVSFNVTGRTLATSLLVGAALGMGFALVMGALGGALPARLAARKPVLEALRAV
jgi:ABC-type antimicrobial peptide transport system permease subunit